MKSNSIGSEIQYRMEYSTIDLIQFLYKINIIYWPVANVSYNDIRSYSARIRESLT